MLTSKHNSLADCVLPFLPYVSLVGVALLFANIVLSFEEPHWEMLTAAAFLIVAAPLGMLIHLAATPELTRDEKRRWLAALVSRKGPVLFAAYFNVTDRARAGQLLASGDRSTS